MKSLSTWVSLESLNNIFSTNAGESGVYYNHFRDIAVRRYIGIVTRPVADTEGKG